jgi:predicted PurR-regulated permease PerM
MLLASVAIPEFQSKKLDYAKALQARAESIAVTIDTQLDKLSGFVDQFDESPGEVTDPANTPRLIPPVGQMVKDNWDNKIIIDWLGQTEVLGRITSVASKSFFVLIIMIFVLAESGRYNEIIKAVIRVRGPDLRGFQNSSQDLQKYLAIKTGASAVTGILAWVSCTILGVDFPVLWGLVAFVFNYIPAVGSIMAAIPPIILALIQMGFWPAVGVLVCYLVINITIGNFIEPMLLGERFGISTLVVIISVLFWGFVWGPVGMFLAVPLTMMVKVMLDNSSDLKWISVLMGKAPVLQRRRRKLRPPGTKQLPEVEASGSQAAPPVVEEEPA